VDASLHLVLVGWVGDLWWVEGPGQETRATTGNGPEQGKTRLLEGYGPNRGILAPWRRGGESKP
jgi:hypothetical protein